MKPRRGRPKKRELVVSPAQKIELERLARQSRSARSVAFRAQIILECAGGASNAAVAAKLRTTGFTVGLWRNRFIAEEGSWVWAMNRVLGRRVRLAMPRSKRWCG